MTEIFRPFNYVWLGRFSNRKRRTVTATLKISQSEFLADNIAVVCAKRCGVEIAELTGRLQVEPGPNAHVLLPSRQLRQGSILHITAQLHESVGRRRPSVLVFVNGRNVHEVKKINV